MIGKTKKLKSLEATNTTVPTQYNRNLIRSPLSEGENLSIIVLPVNGKLKPSFVRRV